MLPLPLGLNCDDEQDLPRAAAEMMGHKFDGKSLGIFPHATLYLFGVKTERDGPTVTIASAGKPFERSARCGDYVSREDACV